MRVDYDDEFGVLRVDAAKRAVSSSLHDNVNIYVHMATEDGRDIVGFAIMGAGYYLPLGKRCYDGKTDTLTLGDTTDAPELISECGDFVGYWDAESAEEGEYEIPIGVALKRASVHLAEVSAQIAGVPA